MKPESISSFISKVNQSIATHIFVGGSDVSEGVTETLVVEIKKYTDLPVVLFPGDVIQITDKADGILFLSLISGRNPDYLIGKHIEAVSRLKNSDLEVLPTGYLLIENGKQTSVELVSQTKPLKRTNIDTIVNTAKAGELLGMKLIYLEAGSGATHAIESEIISKVKQELKVPLIVGGGIRTKKTLESAYKAGADIVVIGTAFEENEAFFDELKK
jgi:putative glycerol-1-phosphate prenyltransferase